jgi:hypothetical protein
VATPCGAAGCAGGAKGGAGAGSASAMAGEGLMVLLLRLEWLARSTRSWKYPQDLGIWGKESDNWWYTYPSEKNLFSWDYSSQYMEK